MKQSERPSNEKGGAPQGEVHIDQILRILSKLSQMNEMELEVTAYLASEVLNL